MNVGRPSHVEVGAHRNDVLGIKPIGALGDIGLITPDLRKCIGKIGVPIVKTHVDAAEELQESGSSRIGQVRHCRNRREAEHAVGSILLGGIETGGSDYLQHLIPTGAPEAALAPGLLNTDSLLLIRNNGLPGLCRIGVSSFGLAPQVDKSSTDIRIFDANRAVDVPGGRHASLAATRLIRWDVATQERVVGLLHLPRDNPVLDVDGPRTPAGAIHAVGRANDVVVLPAVAVELFPVTRFGVYEVLNPTHTSTCLPSRMSFHLALDPLDVRPEPVIEPPSAGAPP